MHPSAAVENGQTRAIGGRPFRLFDAMVMMGALAMALAWDQGRLRHPSRWIVPPFAGKKPIPIHWQVAGGAANITELLFPFLATGSAAVAALRLAKPRPRLHRLLRQPGAIACLLTSLGMVPVVSAVMLSRFSSGVPSKVAWAKAMGDLQPESLIGLTMILGLAVGVTWVVMLVRRLWAPEASWVDRSGRILGLGWIAMIPAGFLVAVFRLSSFF